MNKIKILALTNTFSFLVLASIFYFTDSQLVNRDPNAEITNLYNIFLIPLPELSFIVWGVIYTSLAIFCLYHIIMAYTRSKKHNANQDITRMSIFFILNNSFASGWVIALSNGKLLLSLVLLILQFAAIIIIHYRLNIYKRYRRARTNICTQLPLSIYLAWLTLLAFAGFSFYLQLSGKLWTVTLIGLIVFITLLFIFIRHNIFYCLQIIAGLYGINAKAELLARDTNNIILYTWVGIGILAISSFIKLIIDFLIKEPYAAVLQRTSYD